MSSDPRAAHPWLRLALAGLAGYAWGAASAGLPAPSDPSVFWLGNLAAPYLVLSFLAGAWQRRPGMAALAGAVTCGLAIAGFYGFLLVGDVTNVQLDLPVTTTAREVVIQAYGRWLGTFLLGDPGGIPWLSIGTVTGIVAGLLGHRWRTGGATWAAGVVALAVVAEPVRHLLGAAGLGIGPRYALSASNAMTWGLEAAVGVAAIGALPALRRRRLSRTAAATADQDAGASSSR